MRLAAHALLATSILAACASDETDPVGPAPRATACPGSPGLAELAVPPRFAVVLTDYASTAIAVLDDEAEPLSERWLDSGTRAPGLVAALSGDVDLPTRQANDGTFTVIDRFRTDVVSRFCVPDGTLVGQVRTHGPATTAGWSSNPHDFAWMGERDAWISRFEPNPDPDAAPDDAGSDLIHVDPVTMERTGRRIDLSVVGGTATLPSAMRSVHIPARPSRVVRVGERLVVGLARIALGIAAAGGMVALVDPRDETVEPVELSGLANCARVVPVPGADTRVLVVCAGFANPFGDQAMTRATAGIVLLEIDDAGAVTEVARHRPEPDGPVAASWVVSLGGVRALAVVQGVDGVSTDRLVQIELGSPGHLDVHTSTMAFAIGTPVWDGVSGTLLVPDAASGLLVFRRNGDALEPAGSRVLAPELGIPARHAYLLE